MLKKLALATAAMALITSTASADYYIVQEKATRSARSSKRVQPRPHGSRSGRRPSKPNPMLKIKSKRSAWKSASPRFGIAAGGEVALLSAITSKAAQRPSPRAVVSPARPLVLALGFHVARKCRHRGRQRCTAFDPTCRRERVKTALFRTYRKEVEQFGR